MRIAVFNQKGGVGKTTTVLNLAAALARRQTSTLMVDLDPQAHLSAILGDQPVAVNRSLYAFYQSDIPLGDLMLDWPCVGKLIPAHGELIKVDSIFGKGPGILNKLRHGLDAVDAQNGRDSAVLIDCCPFLGVLSLNAIFAADRVLIPVSSDFLSMRGAQQIERTLAALEPVLKRRMDRRYLLTRYDRRRRMSAEVKERMNEAFPGEVCTTVISENVTVAESPAKGKDVFSHAADSRGARDYQALSDELLATGFL